MKVEVSTHTARDVQIILQLGGYVRYSADEQKLYVYAYDGYRLGVITWELLDSISYDYVDFRAKNPRMDE